MYIERAIYQQIFKRLFQGKVLIIYGPRQSGKTTLLLHLIEKLKDKKIKLVNGDDPFTSRQLENTSVSSLDSFVRGYEIVLIDEAQYIHNIGITLKLLHDHFPNVQIIATGSSSFELANKVVEPLTGRNFEFYILPFSANELVKSFGKNSIEHQINQRLIFGSYPEIVLAQEDLTLRLQKIATDYTSKDILKFDRIRRSEKIIALLRALALQIGQEVSYLELSQLIGIDRETIERYMIILEQSFIIFRLEPYTANTRRALKRMRKIYFWDTGLRNAIINNLNPLDLRNDSGFLFENFIISEFFKKDRENLTFKRFYFWRAYDGEEIDLLVESGGKLEAYECKLNNEKGILYKSQDAPVREVKVITTRNFLDFFGK